MSQSQLLKVIRIPFRLKKNFGNYRETILWIMKKRERKDRSPILHPLMGSPVGIWLPLTFCPIP